MRLSNPTNYKNNHKLIIQFIGLLASKDLRK